MLKFNFDSTEYCYYRHLMNSNFRVKVGSRLVGFSGLVLSVGYEYAKTLVQRTYRRFSLDVHRVKLYNGVVVSFYAK